MSPTAPIGKLIVNGGLQDRTALRGGSLSIMQSRQPNPPPARVEPTPSMADKKLEKALYGPSTTEVALGAILGLISGLLVACVYLVFKPVQQVKELPKEPVRGAVYYIPGADASAKSKGFAAKQKAFIGGAPVEFTEDELNAWSVATFGAEAAAKPAAQPGGKPGDASQGYDGIFNPGTPNFHFAKGSLQIGSKCVLNWYGLTHEVVVLTTGNLVRSGDDVVYVPQTIYLGSCPVHLIPGLAEPLLSHLVSKKKVPDEVKSAWAKVGNATIEGTLLKLTLE